MTRVAVLMPVVFFRPMFYLQADYFGIGARIFAKRPHQRTYTESLSVAWSGVLLGGLCLEGMLLCV